MASEEVDDSKNFKQSFSIIMAKANEQYEEILDELSILKSKNIASEQRLANIESLLAKLLQKESPPPVTPDMNSSKATIPYSTLMDAVYDGIASYYSDMPDSTGVLSDKNIKNIGYTFMQVYGAELKKQRDKNKEEFNRTQEEYKLKREAQGIKTLGQVAEWASEYSPEVQWAIRFIGWKTIHEDESEENVHKMLKVWGDALQTITSPKPPTLKAWCLYKWKNFMARTDKWGLLQWQLVIIGTMVCVFSSAIHQKMTMELDRINRVFYKNVIMNEKRKKDYQELDSLIHSDSFFKTYWSLDH